MDETSKSTYHFSPSLVKSMSTIGLKVEDIIEDDRTKSVINAYKCKSELLRNDSKNSLLIPAQTRIYSDSPIVHVPEGKYNHFRGAVINPLSPSKSKSQLSLTKSPSKTRLHYKTITNADSVHNKLSNAENFPHTYKKKFDENSVDVSGNFISDPRKAINLLKSTSSAALNIPGRSSDFSSEVNWRMQLRNY